MPSLDHFYNPAIHITAVLYPNQNAFIHVVAQSVFISKFTTRLPRYSFKYDVIHSKENLLEIRAKRGIIIVITLSLYNKSYANTIPKQPNLRYPATCLSSIIKVLKMQRNAIKCFVRRRL